MKPFLLGCILALTWFTYSTQRDLREIHRSLDYMGKTDQYRCNKLQTPPGNYEVELGVNRTLAGTINVTDGTPVFVCYPLQGQVK